MGNAIEWLAKASAGGARRTGRTTFNASIVRVKTPAGGDVPLLNLRGEPTALLTVPGVYTAEASGGAMKRPGGGRSRRRSIASTVGRRWPPKRSGKDSRA